MHVTDAAQTLAELDTLRADTRRRLNAMPFALILFGSASLMAALSSAIAGEEAQGIFWSIAGPVGGIVVGAYYWRRELDLGLARAGWPYVVTAVALVIVASMLGGALDGAPWGVGPWLAVAAGYLIFGWLERSVTVIALALALGALALALGVTGATPVAALLDASFGVALLAAGIVDRNREPGR